MPKFSRRSLDKLETCDSRLQELMNEVIKYIDISIIDGQRSSSQQDLLYEKGYSKVKFPNSKHNSSPSMAVDVMLWNKEKPHIRWNDKVQQAYVAGFIKAVAEMLGIKIRQGCDWNGDMIFNESFFDGPHIEIKD